MNLIKFSDDAERLNISIEVVRTTYENALSIGKIHGVIIPKKDEIIRFKLAEIDALAIKLGAGSVSLDILASELNLMPYQVRLILDYLLKNNKISGVLSNDNKFISNKTVREAVIKIAQKNENINVIELSSQLNVTEESISSIIDGISKQILVGVAPYNQIRMADLSKETEMPEAVMVALLKKLIREGTLIGHLDMVNNVLKIERAPTQSMSIEQNDNQLTPNTETHKPKPSDAWYIIPFFFGLIGGLIGYLVVKDDDPDKAVGLLYFGILMSFIYVIVVWLYWSWILSLFHF
jgi:hypothetical protein